MGNTNFQTIYPMGSIVNDMVKQATGRENVKNINMDYVTVAQNKVVEEHELYPVGTDIVKKYVKDEGYSFTPNTTFSAGEIVSGDYATEEVYIPINPAYTYEKNNRRLQMACWYDEDKNYISYTTQNNTSVQELTGIPQNAAFVRFATLTGVSASQFKVTRIA